MASPNGSLLTTTSAVLISHLSRESRAAVAGKPGLAGYRSSGLQTALGGHAKPSGG